MEKEQPKINWQRLLEPFAPRDVEWRVQQSGMSTKGQPYAMVLAYVTNRAIQQRLDDVVGPAKWKNAFETAPDGGVLCGISIKVDDEWVTKWDGAENTAQEAVKGGLSGAMKRSAVQWGIGRYLYKLDVIFAQLSKDKTDDFNQFLRIVDKNTKKVLWSGYWRIPELPEWAQPKPVDNHA